MAYPRSLFVSRRIANPVHAITRKKWKMVSWPLGRVSATASCFVARKACGFQAPRGPQALNTGGRLQPVLMRPPPPAICQNLVAGGGGYWRYSGGGGFPREGGLLEHHAIPSFSNASRSSVAMVCHWAVPRVQNKDQRHSTPFKEGRTRTKHIVPLSTKHAKKKSAPLVPWPLHHYLSKLEGRGGHIHGLGPAAALWRSTKIFQSTFQKRRHTEAQRQKFLLGE